MPFRKLRPELQQKAKEELNEIPEHIQENLRFVRKCLHERTDLNARTDAQWILSFLRGCKFNLSQTVEKIKMFYATKTTIPEFYANRDPFLPEIQEILNLGLVLPLPRTADPTAPRPILIRCEPLDPKRIFLDDVAKTAAMINDILMYEDDNFIIGGHTIFVDFKGLTLNHMVLVTPSLIKKFALCLQKSFPSSIKKIYFVNSPFTYQNIQKFAKRFNKGKTSNKIYFYDEKRLDDVSQSVPLSILPKEYGGHGYSLHELTRMWKNKVESYEKWFIEDAKYCFEAKKILILPKFLDYPFNVRRYLKR